MTIPSSPKIYHITYFDNLRSIIQKGAIYSDSYRFLNIKKHTNIGMSEIKRRRLEEIEVKCNPGTKVGDYVPFYFCPRSIMLYLMYKRNHPDLPYSGGQTPIVHIRADIKKVVAWAKKKKIKWAFSDRNAGIFYAEFYNNLSQLKKINWNAVNSDDFRSSDVKDGKQSEFLLYKSFPIEFIELIGVKSDEIKLQVSKIVKGSVLENKISVNPQWYF